MMKLRSWALSWLLLAACSSGETHQATCDEVLCSDSQGPWCCPFLTMCAPTHGLCDPGCPLDAPTKCVTTSTADICCPAGYTCGPSDTCLPPGGIGGTGGTSSVAGGGTGGGMSASGSGGSTGSAGGFGFACSTAADCPPRILPCCVDRQCTPGTGDQCICLSGADCSTGVCAPAVDQQGSPSGPYVCAPNDGHPYHGCRGLLTACDTGFCCFTDPLDNQFCATPCTTDAQCGDASCNTYSRKNTTCGGTLGCGPTP
jgi:hypothetical protein